MYYTAAYERDYRVPFRYDPRPSIRTWLRRRKELARYRRWHQAIKTWHGNVPD